MGTSRHRLPDELGWESLYHRRWYRRLCHFFTLKATQYPEYLYSQIPSQRHINYNLRNSSAYQERGSRTDRFLNTYFPNVIAEWNQLNKDTKISKSYTEFKRNLITTVRPNKNSTYDVYDIDGIKRLTNFRVEFSPLNGHRFRHSFYCINPLFTCGRAIEDNEHYLLHCHMFNPMRRDLFGQLDDIPGLYIKNLDLNALCKLLLFGNSKLNVVTNRIILEATIAFIDKTKRFK